MFASTSWSSFKSMKFQWVSFSFYFSLRFVYSQCVRVCVCFHFSSLMCSSCFVCASYFALFIHRFNCIYYSFLAIYVHVCCQHCALFLSLLSLLALPIVVIVVIRQFLFTSGGQRCERTSDRKCVYVMVLSATIEDAFVTYNQSFRICRTLVKGKGRGGW